MIISDGMRHKTYNKNIMVGILLAEKALLKSCLLYTSDAADE